MLDFSIYVIIPCNARMCFDFIKVDRFRGGSNNQDNLVQELGVVMFAFPKSKH